MIYLLFILFLLLAFTGIPVAFALGIPTVIYVLIHGISFVLIAQKMFTGMDSFLLTAIPLFILAGNLMNAANLTKELVDFCKLLVGRIRGGMAHANVLISMIFAGMTGAGVSDTAAVGSILIPGMVKDGYKEDFTCAVTAISSTIGPVIPPSIPFLVYASMTGTSVGALFLAGVIPGILLGLSQMLVIVFKAKKLNLPRLENPVSLKQIVIGGKNATMALVMPVIILGGIVGGLATPTESAAIAAFYAFIVAAFIRKSVVTPKIILKVFIDSAITTGGVMILLGTASIFSYILTIEMFPEKIADLVMSLTSNKIVILLLVNIVLLIIGMFLDVIPAMLVMTPVFLPLVHTIGVSTLHFGVIMVLNLVIGLATPPVGMCLFVAANIGKRPIETVSKALIPFLIAVIFVLLFLTYWPAVVMWVPKMFGYV